MQACLAVVNIINIKNMNNEAILKQNVVLVYILLIVTKFLSRIAKVNNLLKEKCI